MCLRSGPIQKVGGGGGGGRFRSRYTKSEGGGGASGPIYETGADTGILKGGGGGVQHEK